MQRTRREALDEFLGFVRELGDAAARTKAQYILDRVIEMVWQKHGWADYQSPVPVELTLSVGQRSYALPDYVARLGRGLVRSVTRGGEPLGQRTPDQLDDEYPDNGTSAEVPGTPRLFKLAGTTGVLDQPTPPDGEALEVASTDDSDTDVEVTLEGDSHLHEWTRTQVTLTGTTPVSVGTWAYLDGFGKSYTATSPLSATRQTSRGTVYLRVTATQRVLQRLLALEAAREHRVITVYPRPATAETLAIPVMRRAKRLLHDADPLPGDWWPAVFRGMVLVWRELNGEIAAAPDSWPELVTLIQNDNRLSGKTYTKGWS